MKKNLLKFLLLVILCLPNSVFAYTEGDTAATSSKAYNFLMNDVNNEDVIRLYNPNNKTVPSYFNLNDYYYENYNFHIPVANQKNLGLCATFATVKTIETSYALKSRKYVDLSERYLDIMTTSDFLGKRTTGYICVKNVCSDGDATFSPDIYALVESFGAPLEKEIPYVNYTEDDYDLFNNSHNVLKLNSTVEFPLIAPEGENWEEWMKILKVHIMEYSSLHASICAPKGAVYNPETAAHYTKSLSDCTSYGHAVSIVGWDDNYSKENFTTHPEHDGAFIALNSWGGEWGNNGYFYISYDDFSVLTGLTGVLDVVEAKKYNIYSKSANLFDISGAFGISELGGLYKFTAMKFETAKENEYLSHIAIAAGNMMSNNNSAKIKFYLNPVDDTFDKEKLIYLGEELPSVAQSSTTIITLDEPIQITGNKFALVYEAPDDPDNIFRYEKAVDRAGNALHGFTYTSRGFDQPWSVTKSLHTVFPAFAFTIDELVENVSIKTEPNKKTYMKGQPIDLTGGVLNVTYKNTTTAEIDMTDSAVKPFDYDTDTLGNQTVTVLYEGKKLTYDITVIDGLKSISVKTNPTKTSYIKGENLDLTGGKIIALYEDNSTKEILMTDETVSVIGYDKNTLGTQELTISYKGKTTTINVTVLNNICTVTFITNSESGNSTQTISYNSKAVRPDNPVKLGHTFKEWQLNGIAYDFDSLVTSDITLIATWETNQYTITFDTDGGSNITSQTVNYNGKVTKPVDPTKEGYTFKEWQLNGVTYDFNSIVNSNITLTALWDKALSNILMDEGYTISGNYVSSFKLGDTIEKLRSELGNDVTIESQATLIATGTVIKKGNESYTVVIKGDLTGDGKINSTDLLQMRKYLLEEITLTGAYKKAGMIESQNSIKSLDLLRLRQYLLDEYVIK